jgi:hypothetical protein
MRKVVWPVRGYKPIIFQRIQVCIAPASLLPGMPELEVP